MNTCTSCDKIFAPSLLVPCSDYGTHRIPSVQNQLRDCKVDLVATSTGAVLMFSARRFLLRKHYLHFLCLCLFKLHFDSLVNASF